VGCGPAPTLTLAACWLGDKGEDKLLDALHKREKLGKYSDDE